MTDQTIPAGLTREEARAVREWAERSLTLWDPDVPVSKAARVVLAALPAPPRPTLADMTPEERAACQWMQADVVNRRVRYVIANPLDEDDEIALIDHDGDICWFSPEYVTPRPDLPRLTWPGTEKPAPAPALPEGWRLADHKDNGRVIVTNTTPNSDGDVYFVIPAENPLGYDWYLCAIDELTFLDQGDDTPTGPGHLAVGTVIESADDPRIAALPAGSILLDREGDTTTKRHGAWTGIGYTPIPSEGTTVGPWTVLHIPKEEA